MYACIVGQPHFYNVYIFDTKVTVLNMRHCTTGRLNSGTVHVNKCTKTKKFYFAPCMSNDVFPCGENKA